MTLASLLEVLKENLNLMLTIVDDAPIITFDAAGKNAISAEFGAREVDRIGVASVNLFHIYLKPVPSDPEPEPGPDEP